MQTPRSQEEKSPMRPMTPGELDRQKRIRKISWRKMLLLYPIAWLIRIWLASLRFEFPQKQIEQLKNSQDAFLILFWHNRLFIAAELKRRFRKNKKINGLVSPSSDGAWLVAFFKTLGIGAIRGSTSRRGGSAILEIIHKINAGEDVAITPDGPRGPLYKFTAGAALIAQKTQCPILFVGSEYSSAIRLNSWDKFILPLPFSKVTLDVKILKPEKTWQESSLPDLAESFNKELQALTHDL